MKKVCLIVPNKLTVPAVLGGAIENLVTLMARANEERKQLDLIIISPYNEKAEIESKAYNNTKFIYIKKNIFYYFLAIFYKILNKIFKTSYNAYNHLCINKIKNKKFDYIIAEGGAYDYYLEFLKYFSRDQLILHLHHQWHGTKNIDKTFSKLIGVSKFVVDDFKKTSIINEYTVLKNGIKLDNFDRNLSISEKNNIYKNLGLNRDDFVIIYCGRLIKEKGILELIRAVKEIEDDKVKLLIIGSANFENAKKNEFIEKLETEVSEYSDRIKFTGYINNNELYKYYSIGNVLCIPSLCEDAAPLTSIEGMISKKPLIVTNKGGIPEYINKNGSIVLAVDNNIINNLKKSIVLLSKNDEECIKMGIINYNSALKYDYKKFFKEFVKIIDSYK